MKTDVITISDDLKGKEEVLETADKFNVYNELSHKNSIYVRLLTEETVSMIHGIIDNFKGRFWIESEKVDVGLLVRICLSANKTADDKAEEQLLSVASSGKNESAKGVLGKIREAFRVSLQPLSGFMGEFGEANMWYAQGINTSFSNTSAGGAACWSLRDYKHNISADKDGAKEEWDELEKSIIAKLADDVKVWLNRDTTEVVIEKMIVQ